MAYNLGTEESPLWVNLRVSDGIVGAIVRTPDLDTFYAAAKAAGLMVEITEPVTDEETGDITQVGTGKWRNAEGVTFDHLGPVTITAAVLDDEGAEVTPAVMDHRHHVNIRLTPPAIRQRDPDGALRWHKWAAAWSDGSPDLDNNAAESALILMGVSLIDPDTINSPSRVWL
jgi:hypothetical protein